MKKIAHFEATQIGFRVTIKAGSKVIASSHFAAHLTETGYGTFASTESIELAYKAAKSYAASFGCE